jgi:MtN3 and saliva related transmembrane protein
MIDAIGLVAATLTTLAFVPQAVKTWRTGSTGDISLATFSALCVGVVLWLAYGLAKGDWPIILANAVTLPLAGSIWFIAVRNRLRPAAPDEPPPVTAETAPITPETAPAEAEA